MKIRQGFVSNSSSSSFICKVCGDNQSGWDISLSEAEMYECEAGHIFCRCHIIGELVRPEGSEDDEDYDEDEIFDGGYGIPSKHCPICQLKAFDNDEMLSYVLKTRTLNKQELEQEIRSKFSNHAEFLDFMKGDKKK
jgi:hypothetical protein